jgi:glycosyltransferase involved in cell wall biosynthesis
MHIVLIAKPGHENSGVGRYTRELSKALDSLGLKVTIIHPVVPLPGFLIKIVKHFAGWDLEAFFYNYPLWERYPQADLYHLTSQNLATLMIFHRPPGRTVVTVDDIIPWLVRDDPELRSYRNGFAEIFDRLAMKGLRRVDGILCISDFSLYTLEKALDPPVKIKKTILLGVN